MAHFKSASLLALITWPGLFHLGFSSAVLHQTAHTGEDVTLKCQNKNAAPVIVVEWTRPDLKPSEYVYFFRDERSERINQHPSFKNRVELSNREMKNGDLSLILKNATKDDSGTYECRCLTDGARRRKRAMIDTEPISIIILQVLDPPAAMAQRGVNEPVMAESVMKKGSTENHDSNRPAGRGHAAVAVVPILLIAVVAAAVVVSLRVKTERTTSQT